MTRRAQAHGQLVEVVAKLLRRKRGATTLVTTLRRLLRMAGMDPGVAELAAAVLEVGGRYGRLPAATRDRRRAFVDVELRAANLPRVAAVVGAEFERQLAAEGMPRALPTERGRAGEGSKEPPVQIAAKAVATEHWRDTVAVYLEARGHEVPRHERQALRLYGDGLSFREMEERTGVSEFTLRNIVRRHELRAGIDVPPRLRRARKYLETHPWGPDEGQERAVWERFAGGDGYRTISKALRMEWQEVTAILQKHRLRAGIPPT